MCDTNTTSYSHLNGVLPSNAKVRRICVGLDEYLVPPPIRAGGGGYLLYLGGTEGFCRFKRKGDAQKARLTQL